jgi:transcriptional regulator with XRE-family HTH domain
MSELAMWLRAQMQDRGYSKIQTSMHTGVAMGTLSEILQKDHIAQIETLFRLADYFDTDRIEMLVLAGHLQTADQFQAEQGLGRPRAQPVLSPDPSEAEGPDKADYLVRELPEEFHRVPDEWKQEVFAQARMFVRPANRPPVRIIGDESEDTEAQPEEEEEQPRAREPSEQVPAQVA